MIRSISDILDAFRAAEAAELAKSNITHPVLIGNMYEGLTQEILERAIPPGLGLQVVGGLIIDGFGGQSGQIDCMLVQGAGTPVPYVHNQYQWHVKDVIAVFEVKKNLYAGDLTDAYGHLGTVLQSYSNWIQNQKESSTVNLKPTLRGYAQATGKVAPPSDEWREMPMDEHMILTTIMTDQLAPVRIIFGYEGYGTENGLRRGLVDYLKENQKKSGFGPYHLPNLIVAKGGSLVKLSGHPYLVARRADGSWPILASTHANPILLMLELIWTRLSYQFELAQLFGDDLDIESMAPLLDAEPKYDETLPAKWGWNYHVRSFKASELKSAPTHVEWEPVVLTDIQHVVMNQLCKRDIPTDEPDFQAFLKAEGVDAEVFIKELVATGLVASDGNFLRLTTDQFAAVLLPDGRFVGGENNTGRLMRWVGKYLNNRQPNHPS